MSQNNANPADEVMCSCSGTKRGEILNLFEQGLDMDAVSRRTGAISGCGGCEWDIAELQRKLAEQKNKEEQGS